jgi:hypothetical protein
MPIHQIDQTWVLETAATGYALGLDAAGRLVHCYWGKRLPRPLDYPAPARSLAKQSLGSGRAGVVENAVICRLAAKKIHQKWFRAALLIAELSNYLAPLSKTDG